MKKVEKIFKALKVLMINLIICSLMQNPFISNAMAAGTQAPASGGFNTNDIFQMANGALNLYGGFLGQKQAMIQSQIASANNQRLMSQLGPGCRKPDGSACFASPAKYFPECSVPASMSNFPANACESTTPDPNQIASMLTYESISQGWMNYYDQMKNEASNSTVPTGLRCLKDKQAAMKSQLTEMMNNLQRMQDQLKKDSQVFRDNNKQLLNDMDTAKAELFGGDQKDITAKTKDVSKLFSPACQSVMKNSNLVGQAGGLNGVLQGLSAPSKAAGDFSLNKAAIEADIRRETDNIAAQINTNGLDAFNGYKQSTGMNFKAIDDQMARQGKEFQTARARITQTLKDAGYTNPIVLDSNFSADSSKFLAGADEYFKKKIC